jgi:hypothetical protein
VKKIPSLFARNYETDRLIRDEVVPGCEWVLAGEGAATVKYDGTACCIFGGRLFTRYEIKQGRERPRGFVPAQEPDPVTGDVPGWIPVGDGPEHRWHREAWGEGGLRDGTYELIGPKVQGNPYHMTSHSLVPHGAAVIGRSELGGRSFGTIRDYLAHHSFEGIVFWRDLTNPDCDKCKVKRRDYRLPWPVKEELP